jgi:hypothetical protein
VTVGRVPVAALVVVGLLACGVLTLARVVAPDSLEIESSDYQDFYRPVADRLVEGHGLTTGDGELAVRYPPGYPVLLAATSWVADGVGMGRDTADDVVGYLLFAASAMAFAVVAAALVGPGRGLAATALWIVWPITVGLALIRSSDQFFILLSLAATGLTVRLLRRDEASTAAALGLGAVAGASVLVRPTGVALVAGIAVALLTAGMARRGALALAGAALVVLPWVIGAGLAADRFVPDSTGGLPTAVDGLSFGIDPDEQGSAPLTGGMRDLMEEAEARTPELLDGTGKLAGFLGDQVEERPGSLALLVGYKAARGWYGTESLRYEPTLFLLALLFVPLSVVGLVRWRRRPDLGPVVTLLVVTIGVAWLMTTLTLSIHRYLAPAAGLLLIPVVDLLAERLSRSP